MIESACFENTQALRLVPMDTDEEDSNPIDGQVWV